MTYILIVSRLFLTLEKTYARHFKANNLDFFLSRRKWRTQN